MEDINPNLAPNSLTVSCMVWNVQGGGSQNFLAALRVVVRTNKPNVIALVETHVGSSQAGRISNMLDYSGMHELMRRVLAEACGFSGNWTLLRWNQL